MNDDLHALRRHVEQAARLDHFESLVHQSGRVDRDALAHLPRRMVQRLFDRNFFEVGFWRIEKRPAAGGKPNAFDLIDATAAHALMDGVVLAIDRQEWLALPAR